jgi:GNAT superfamily N-acetyltransferase
MTVQTTIRPLTPGDVHLLVQASLGNLNWRVQRFTEQDVKSRSEFRHYTELDAARGDFGFVAESAGEGIGTAWAQFLPAADPGYGFFDDATPEVSLWVRQDLRGQGLGTRLLRRLQTSARARGIPRLSLSVGADNCAKRLYAAEGFMEVAGRERDGVMVWSSDTGWSAARMKLGQRRTQ